MKKFLFDCGTRDFTASFGLFVLRVSIGLMMILGHGIAKIKAFDQLKTTWIVPDFFPLKFMSHPVSLMATIGAEVLAAGLIVIGLATRPAAFILAFAMVIAAFDQLGDKPFAVKELALMYLVGSVVILLTGAGTWSLDAIVHKDSKRRRW
jgi:putative oxidoreductase